MRAISVLAAGASLASAMPVLAQDWAALRDALLEQAGELFGEEGYDAIGFIHEGALDNASPRAVKDSPCLREAKSSASGCATATAATWT